MGFLIVLQVSYILSDTMQTRFHKYDIMYNLKLQTHVTRSLCALLEINYGSIGK